MAEFKKKKINSFWHSPLALGFLFCVIFLFIYSMVGLIQKERETAQKKALSLDQIETLKQRQIMLEGEISKLGTDEGIEEAIRDSLPMAKPEERMVTIIDDQKIDTSPSSEKSEHSFWGWIKKMFVN